MSCHLSDKHCRPFENLDRMGLMNSRMIAVHMTQLSSQEISRLAATEASVVHCPTSNLKLASGGCNVFVCPSFHILASAVLIAALV